jgi:arylsulfatase A-like enzyme
MKRLFIALSLLCQASIALAADKPNILVIMGDDIGLTNISYVSRGMMGYKTPNIDRIANEGMFFTDYYGEQSCTAGRSAFILGQSPVRTGLTKVGLPGAPEGIHPDDPTIAEILKPLGYTSGQFGKNHLGDRDEFLPTNHGFDEFFGNLYHLNAEEEPERETYFQDPRLQKMFSPRGVIHSYADGRIEDVGALTKKRMEKIDDDFLNASVRFMERAHQANKPFFVWFNSTRMHYFTHVPDEYRGRSGLNEYADGMIQHDDNVGVLLKTLDDMGIADNTIVIYTTDNGPHLNMWPDAGMMPFRGEKNTNWEGGFRVPAFVRWPAKVEAGSVYNGVMSHQDWFPTLLAAAGVNDIAGKLKQGYTAGDKTFKVHLDGYDFMPVLTGQTQDSPRKAFFYFSDDADLLAVRILDRWKLVFAEQRSRLMNVWREPFVKLRAPLIFDLRMDPFERAQHESNSYELWFAENTHLVYPARPIVGQFVMSFQQFPPRMKPGSFNVDGVTSLIYSAMPK